MTTPVAAPPKMTAEHLKLIRNLCADLEVQGETPEIIGRCREILSHVSSEVQQEGVWVPRKEAEVIAGFVEAEAPDEEYPAIVRRWLESSR